MVPERCGVLLVHYEVLEIGLLLRRAFQYQDDALHRQVRVGAAGFRLSRGKGWVVLRKRTIDASSMGRVIGGLAREWSRPEHNPAKLRPKGARWESWRPNDRGSTLETHSCFAVIETMLPPHIGRFHAV